MTIVKVTNHVLIAGSSVKQEQTNLIFLANLVTDFTLTRSSQRYCRTRPNLMDCLISAETWWSLSANMTLEGKNLIVINIIATYSRDIGLTEIAVEEM